MYAPSPQGYLGTRYLVLLKVRTSIVMHSARAFQFFVTIQWCTPEVEWELWAWKWKDAEMCMHDLWILVNSRPAMCLPSSLVLPANSVLMSARVTWLRTAACWRSAAKSLTNHLLDLWVYFPRPLYMFNQLALFQMMTCDIRKQIAIFYPAKKKSWDSRVQAHALLSVQAPVVWHAQYFWPG